MRRSQLLGGVALAVALFPATSLHATELGPDPGSYIADGGWGTLTIKSTGDFSIVAVRANGHICDVEGRMRGRKGEASPAFDPENACVINFERLPLGVRVMPAASDACRAFCGARAAFDGDYLRPPKGCDDAEREAARRAFKSLYDARSFGEAAAKLRPLLTKCAHVLPWLEAGWIRNDLALTEFKLDDRLACLRTLAPLADDAALNDDGLRAKYAPSDFDDYFPIVKAARANLALCRRG